MNVRMCRASRKAVDKKMVDSEPLNFVHFSSCRPIFYCLQSERHICIKRGKIGALSYFMYLRK